MAENYTLPCSCQGGWAGGFNWSLFGLLYVWGAFVLYEYDEHTENRFRGESRGSEVLDDAWRITSVIGAGSSRQTLITPNFHQISDVWIYSCVWFQCPAVEDLKSAALVYLMIWLFCPPWFLSTVTSDSFTWFFCFCFFLERRFVHLVVHLFSLFFFFHCTIPY